MAVSTRTNSERDGPVRRQRRRACGRAGAGRVQPQLLPMRPRPRRRGGRADVRDGNGDAAVPEEQDEPLPLPRQHRHEGPLRPREVLLPMQAEEGEDNRKYLWRNCTDSKFHIQLKYCIHSDFAIKNQAQQTIVGQEHISKF